VARLDMHEMVWVLLGVVVVSLVGLVLGVAATRTGIGSIPLIFTGNPPVLKGFQSGKNSEADVLLIGMMAYALVVREWTESRSFKLARYYYFGLLAGGCMLFAAGVLLTHSRMGVALLPVAIISIVYSSVPYGRRGTILAALGGVFTLAAAAVCLLLLGNQNATSLMVGFMMNHEVRPEIWLDSWYVVKQYFPFGSGMGTFVTVFPAAERLETVVPQFTNRAHNDYIEMLIEGGAFAGLVFFAICGILLRWLWLRLRSSSPAARRHGAFALATLAILALHSIVDYPLRSISLASLAALAVAMLTTAIPAPKSGAKVRKTW
jgi:O-antigen ligase